MRDRERLDPAAQRRQIFVDRPVLRAGLADQRLDHRQDVLDAVIELLVEHALAQVRPAPFLGHDLVVAQHHLHERGPDRFRRLQIRVGPGPRLVAYGLLPDREALARRQPVAMRSGLVGLFRIAGPVQRMLEFLAEEEQIVLRPLRKRDRHDAAGLRAIVRGGRMFGAEPVARPDAATRIGTEMVEQGRQGFRRRRGAGRAPPAADPEADAVARDHPGEFRQGRRQEIENVAMPGRGAEKLVERPPRGFRGREPELLPHQVELDGQELPEHLDRGTLGHVEMLRRIMVAGHHAPERAVDDDGDRH